MRAKAVAALLLFAAAATGAAEPLTWQFTFTGFYDVLTRRFDPARTLGGEFSGEDRNDDGIILHDELTSLLIHGERDYKACEGEESPYYVCGVGPFYFGHGDDLSFSLGMESHDRLRREGGGREIDTTDRDWSYRIVDGVELPSRFYHFTPRTRLQVSLVPEPMPWTMLAGGAGTLLALGALRRRARRG